MTNGVEHRAGYQRVDTRVDGSDYEDRIEVAHDFHLCGKTEWPTDEVGIVKICSRTDGHSGNCGWAYGRSLEVRLPPTGGDAA